MWAHGATATGSAVLCCDWKLGKLNAKCFEQDTWPTALAARRGKHRVVGGTTAGAGAAAGGGAATPEADGGGNAGNGNMARLYGFRIYSEDAGTVKKRKAATGFRDICLVERLRGSQEHILFALADSEPAIYAYKFQ